MRWRDVRREWVADPEFAKALQDEFPYRQLADAVVGLRAEFGLTQEELAQKVGVKQPFIARLESGKHPVDLRTVKRIADALGVNWDVRFSSAKEQAASIGRGNAGGRAAAGRKVMAADIVKGVRFVASNATISLARREAAATSEHGGRPARKVIKWTIAPSQSAAGG